MKNILTYLVSHIAPCIISFLCIFYLAYVSLSKPLFMSSFLRYLFQPRPYFFASVLSKKQQRCDFFLKERERFGKRSCPFEFSELSIVGFGMSLQVKHRLILFQSHWLGSVVLLVLSTNFI